MQSDFYLCSTGLLEGRRETAFGEEKNALQRFLMIQKRTGGITGLNNGKKRSFDMNHYHLLIFWNSPHHHYYVTIHKSTEPSPSCHLATALLLECQLFLLQFRLRPSHFNCASQYNHQHHQYHRQSCDCNPTMSSILFCMAKFSLKVFILNSSQKQRCRQAAVQMISFQKNHKRPLFCNLISNRNRCIYRYFSFINHPQSVSVWLNCFA